MRIGIVFWLKRMRTRSVLFSHSIACSTSLFSVLWANFYHLNQFFFVWPQALFCKNATLYVGVSALFPFSHLPPYFLVSLHLKNYSGNIGVSREFMDGARGLFSPCLLFVHAHAPFYWLKEPLNAAGSICAPSSCSHIKRQQSSCGSVHTVSTINHKHSQIAHRCSHAQEFNHLKSWLHAQRERDAFYNTNRKLYKHPHNQHAPHVSKLW